MHAPDTHADGEIPEVFITFGVGVDESVHLTSYEVMAAPPSEVGADHATVTEVPVLIVNTTVVGIPGTVAEGPPTSPGTGTGEETGGSLLTLPPPGTVLNTGDKVLLGEEGIGLAGVGDGEEGVGEGLSGVGEGEGVGNVS